MNVELIHAGGKTAHIKYHCEDCGAYLDFEGSGNRTNKCFECPNCCKRQWLPDLLVIVEGETQFIPKSESLRQSKRNCYTLGEPLTQKQFYDTLPQTPLIVITKCGDMEVGNRNDFVWETHSKFYLDPRPLPTLPEPEESSLVKRLKSLQRRASGSYDDHVRVDSGALAQVLKEMEKPKE